MQGFFIWLTVFLNLLLPAVLVMVIYADLKYRRKIKAERDVLLQEKEVMLGFVDNIGEVFADSDEVSMDTLLTRVLHYAVRTCKANAGVIYLVNSQGSYLEARTISGIFPPLHSAGGKQIEQALSKSQQLEQIIRNHPIHMGRGLVGEAAAIGNSILVEDAEMDARVPQHKADFLKIHTMLVVPMRFGNQTIGVMCLVNRVNGKKFTMANLGLAQSLADQASIPIHYAGLQEALDQKRQFDRDLQIAQQIQNSLLPRKLPSYSSVELAAFNDPALEIGGDYYDIVQIDEKHIGIVIADVSGKGVGGALMMAVCRSVLRGNAPKERDPAQMLASLNRILSSNLADDMFISMLYMVLNLDTHELCFARAGHEAPLLLRKGELEAVPLPSGGIAIGLAGNSVFAAAIETKVVQLEAGDMVVTYTDGITEAMDMADNEWGLDNLKEAIRTEGNASASDLLENIRQRVQRFVGDRRQYDDMTMLVLKIRRTL
ncbi:MAG: SpoIIE family protein phosphatase [Kiritimatiellales bacterium]|nr:SpoIIE family protein phosphatase [Kiritimatiellales bacterium]